MDSKGAGKRDERQKTGGLVFGTQGPELSFTYNFY